MPDHTDAERFADANRVQQFSTFDKQQVRSMLGQVGKQLVGVGRVRLHPSLKFKFIDIEAGKSRKLGKEFVTGSIRQAFANLLACAGSAVFCGYADVAACSFHPCQQANGDGLAKSIHRLADGAIAPKLIRLRSVIAAFELIEASTSA